VEANKGLEKAELRSAGTNRLNVSSKGIEANSILSWAKLLKEGRKYLHSTVTTLHDRFSKSCVIGKSQVK